MSDNPLHKKIKELYSQGLFGPLLGIECSLSYMCFVPKLDETDLSLRNFAKELSSLLMSGQLPTANPLNDKLIEYSASSFEDALFLYIKDNCRVSTEDVDRNNDVTTIKMDVVLILGNILSFLDQDTIKIESASILTGPFVYRVEV